MRIRKNNNIENSNSRGKKNLGHSSKKSFSRRPPHKPKSPKKRKSWRM